jgi:hypothetical protein
LSSLLRTSMRLSTPLYLTPVTIPSGFDSMSSMMPFLISTCACNERTLKTAHPIGLCAAWLAKSRALTCRRLTLTPALSSTSPGGDEAVPGGPMQQCRRRLQLEAQKEGAQLRAEKPAPCKCVYLYRATGLHAAMAPPSC